MQNCRILACHHQLLSLDSRQVRKTIFGASLLLQGGSLFIRTEEAAEGLLCRGWGLPHV